MTDPDSNKGYVALLGWSLNAIDAVSRFDRRYIIVAPPWAEDYCTQNDIPFMPWDFDRLAERSHELAHRLKDEGVDIAIPLYEETVEWAGAINAVLMNTPRLPGQSMLFRDKPAMKRRAQPGGTRVGVFDEAHDRSAVIRFLKRLHQMLLKHAGDQNDPIDCKALGLIERPCGLNGYQALVVMFDPKTTQDGLDAFFPEELTGATGHAGGFGVEPRRRVVRKPEIPEDTADHRYFEWHELAEPMKQKVSKRTALGTHWGLAYFFAEGPHTLRGLPEAREERALYV